MCPHRSSLLTPQGPRITITNEVVTGNITITTILTEGETAAEETAGEAVCPPSCRCRVAGLGCESRHSIPRAHGRNSHTALAVPTRVSQPGREIETLPHWLQMCKSQGWGCPGAQIHVGWCGQGRLPGGGGLGLQGGQLGSKMHTAPKAGHPGLGPGSRRLSFRGLGQPPWALGISVSSSVRWK